MNRRLVPFLITFFLLSTVLPSLAANKCPECGGKLAKVRSVKNDFSKPSKNISVWNDSICANMFFGPDSVICTQCWLSYSKLMERWERSSELPNSFRRPLSASIRAFPVPPPKNIKSLVVYYQFISGGQESELVSFWCSNSVALISRFRAYARKHNLSIRVDIRGHTPEEVYVAIETKPNA